MAKEFVLVRSPRIGYGAIDLNVFDFDYDLTFMGFFVNADGKVYGRYGGRDSKSPGGKLSIAGLRHAMVEALQVHRREAKAAAAAAANPPALAESIPGIGTLKTDSCIHCHQIYDARRENLLKAGKWTSDMFWVYPLPENVGLTLDNDRGNRVAAVAAGSAAARAGLKAGDLVQSLNGIPVASFGDAQYALHKAPASGTIPVEWARDGKPIKAGLAVAAGWRKTDLKWRPSMRDLSPQLRAMIK